MQLNENQLAIINNLLYAKQPSLYDATNGNPQVSTPRKLGDIVELIDSNSNADSFTSSHEWDIIKNAVKNDETLRNVVVKQSYYDPATQDSGCLLVSGNDAVVAFRGTAKGEWKDNAIAGTLMENTSSNDATVSTQQQKAIDYVNSLDLSGYDSVTATGHSKGGNKAKIVTLLTDKVDRCVSFDGQGFSDEFMKAHEAEIRAKQGRIENHNVDGDYVNILLNDVGTTHWHEGQRVGENFLKNHSPSSLLNENGKMEPGTQSQLTQTLDNALNSMLRSIPQQQKADVLRLTGDIMDAILGTGRDHQLTSLGKILLNPGNWDELKIIFTYLPLTLLSQVPGLDFIIKKLQGLGVLPQTSAGDDIRYDSPEPIRVNEDGGDLIYVNYSDVHALSSQLQRAVENYNAACEALKSAAVALIERWEGEGCNAFTTDQQSMLRWCNALGQSAFNIADSMIQTLQRYRNLENNLKNLMM